MTTDPEVMPSGALARQEPMTLAVSDPESILRYAIDKGANVDVIERMMVVRDKLKAELAKAAFDASMAAFQGECPIIVKRKAGAKNAYRYAPLDDILSQVRELVRRHGFRFSITSEIEPGWVKAFCKITHDAGHSEVSEFKVPVDQKNPMMSDPQRYGGSMTFAKRYAFCNAFGILTADEDLDAGDRAKPAGPSSLRGESATAPPVDEVALKRKLADLTRGVHMVTKGYNMDDAAKMKLNQYLWDENIIADTETVGSLTGARLAEVVAKVERKLQG